jgi:hypothetical protein
MSQHRRELFRPVDATAVGDHHDLLSSIAKAGHHGMEVLAIRRRITPTLKVSG